MIIHDPIRDALRQLVREKRIYSWNVSNQSGVYVWTVCLYGSAALLSMYASEREAA